MNTQTLVFVICAVIGLLDTTYLIYHKLQGTDVACLFFPTEWCRKVQYSSYSKTFGIPNSYLGFGMYSVILAMALALNAGVPLPVWGLQFIIGFGFTFSMYFVYIQAFVLRAFCTWCVVSALNFTVLATAAFLLG